MSPDRMQRQRFEIKYVIDEEIARQARQFVRAHLELDENGVGKPNYSYPVHSLYFDSPLLHTFWSTINGDKNRFKLRVRFYDNAPMSPVFLEIKRRVNSCILKQRAGVRKQAVPALLAGQLPGAEHLLRDDAKSRLAAENFLKLAQKLNAGPVVHVAYAREAWVDPESDRVRITFDRRVRTERRTEATFDTAMVNASEPFGDKVIIEIKFTDRFPNWCGPLVSHFGLMQCGAAKYCEGLAGLPEFHVSHAGDFRERPGTKRDMAVDFV